MHIVKIEVLLGQLSVIDSSHIHSPSSSCKMPPKSAKTSNQNETSQAKGQKNRSAFDLYQDLLNKHPLSVNIIQGAILTALSVATSNLIKSSKVDYKEVLVMALISAFFITPTLLWFYKNILNKTAGSNTRKLIIDQFAFSPPFNACIIALRLALLGSPFASIPGSVYQVFPKAMMYAWCFWIPVRFLTLQLIPPMYHILSGSVFAYVWNVIFSLVLS